MTWIKFNHLNCATWPEPKDKVLWKIGYPDTIHVLAEIITYGSLPSIYDLEQKRRVYLEDNVYWMNIPDLYEELSDIEFSSKMTGRIEFVVVQAEKDIERIKNPDDTFSF